MHRRPTIAAAGAITVALAAGFLPCAAAAQTQEGAPVDVGSRLQLFLDDWLIDALTEVTFELHPPTPRETVLTKDMPWESTTMFYPVVIRDGQRYRMWYRANGPSEGYAESEDAIHWTRPNLGIIEFEGSKENNLVWAGPGANMCPFRDENPAAPPQEQYKSVARAGSLFGQVSPDGLHWRLVQEEPILDDPPFDSHNICFWDKWRQEYVAYTRGVAGAGTFKGGVRWIRRATSKDFRHWSELEPIDLGGKPFEHLYTNAATPYARAEGLYLMFPFRLVVDRTLDPDWEGGPGMADIVFMWSRDGLHFNRFMEAFMRPGPDPRNWHERAMCMGRGVLQTSPTELSMYFVENYRTGSVRIRRATLRTDGFVSVNARYTGGEFTTKPLTFQGRELVINCSTSAVGSVQVEIQDSTGNPIEGFTLAQCPDIFGDEIERVITWESGSDLSALAGRPIRLRFVMKDTDLYSMRFRP